MSKSSELWYEENLKGYETIIKSKIENALSIECMMGHIKPFEDREKYEVLVSDVFRLCDFKIFDFISEEVKNFIS